MTGERSRMMERQLLWRLAGALRRSDRGCASQGEVDAARKALREFYQSLELHP
jgi:hypothetical protein